MATSRKKQTRAKREEAELESAYRSLAPKGKYSKKKKKSHRTGGIIAISIFLVAIILFIVAGYFYLQNAELNGIILENVTVAGVDVGGMTQAEAIDAVRLATANTYSKTPMTVTVLDVKIQLPTSCVGKFDIPGAVKAAYKFGNSGSQEKRQQEQKIAMNSGYAVDLTPYLGLDKNAIREHLDKLGENYNTVLSQSTYEITGEYPNQVLVVQLGTPEYGLNLNDLYSSVLKAYSANTFAVEGYCGMIEPEPIDLTPIAEEHYRAPSDATFHPETYEILEGSDGYGLNLETAQKTLESAKYGTKVEIPFETIKPKVTAKALKALLFRDKITSFTAKAESDPDRDTNLRLACLALDDLEIYPGETFSFNETLGEQTAKRGYKAVPNYSGGKVKEILGEGISQVSSALYHCALICELEILERDNHAYYPGFVPLGLDASVSWNAVDFRFRNNSAYPIRIEAKADGGEITVTIVGTDTRDYRVSLEYETISKTQYDKTYQAMPADNKEGYKDGDYIVEPCEGYKVKTYLCKINKETKKQISRDLIEQSNYAARDAVICKIETNNAQ